MPTLQMTMAALALIALSTSSIADGGTHIEDDAQVVALLLIQAKLDEVSAAVTDCVSAGNEHGKCLCSNANAIEEFRKAVVDSIAEYPALGQLDVVWFKDPAGSSVTQDLAGIRAQAATELACR